MDQIKESMRNRDGKDREREMLVPFWSAFSQKVLDRKIVEKDLSTGRAYNESLFAGSKR